MGWLSPYFDAARWTAVAMDRPTEDPTAHDPGWVDDVLFAGRPTDVCLRLPEPVDRATLHRLVTDAQDRLTAAGLRPGGAAALRLPPSLAYVVNLLATWRAGAQAILLDHRLTDHEVDRALRRLTPQVVVAPVRTGGGALKRLRRRHRGRHRLRRPAGGSGARRDPAQLRLHRPVQGDRPHRRRPGRRGAPLHPTSTGWRCPASGSSCCRPWCTCSGWSAACSTACTPASSWSRRSGSAATPCWPRSPPTGHPGHRARRAVPHRTARLHPRRPARCRSSAG